MTFEASAVRFALPRAIQPSPVSSRRECEREFTVVRSAAPPYIEGDLTESTDATIRTIEQAANRMVESLAVLRERESTIAELHQKIADMQREKDVADEATRQQAARADEAEKLAEQLRDKIDLQAREYARLKSNADRLLAIFAPETT